MLTRDISRWKWTRLLQDLALVRCQGGKAPFLRLKITALSHRNGRDLGFPGDMIKGQVGYKRACPVVNQVKISTHTLRFLLPFLLRLLRPSLHLVLPLEYCFIPSTQLSRNPPYTSNIGPALQVFTRNPVTMSQELKNVIVIGASGNIGQLIVSSLLAANLTVSALTRSTSTATFPPHVSVHKTDYSHASLLAAFKGKDAVVSAIATYSTTQQNAVIDAAVEAGVKRFLPSEYGVDTSRPEIYECLPPAIMKQQVVDYLKTKEKDGLSWTAICVGAWFDWVRRFSFSSYRECPLQVMLTCLLLCNYAAISFRAGCLLLFGLFGFLFCHLRPLHMIIMSLDHCTRHATSARPV